MRPGKPLMFGRLGDTPLLGLPGNPVSSLVCAILYLGPIMDRMLGIEGAVDRELPAILGADVAENDRRQDYLRSTLSRDPDGNLVATPFDRQDSSMLFFLVKSDCLIVRAPHAPAAKKGERVKVIPLEGYRAEI